MILFIGMFFCVFSEEPKNSQKERQSISTILGLTPQQEEDFAKLRKTSASRDSIHFVKLRELRENLLDESAKEKPDAEKINEISLEIGKIYSILSLNLSKNIQEIKNLLTNEQFEKFIEHRKNKANRSFNKKRY
jgi:hypothetical protein